MFFVLVLLIVIVNILTQPQFARQSFLSTNFVHISNIVCKVHVYANFLKKKKNRHKNLVDRNYIEVYLYSFTFLEVLQTIFFLNKLSDFELSLTEVYHNDPVLNLCRVSRY